MFTVSCFRNLIRNALPVFKASWVAFYLKFIAVLHPGLSSNLLNLYCFISTYFSRLAAVTADVAAGRFIDRLLYMHLVLCGVMNMILFNLGILLLTNSWQIALSTKCTVSFYCDFISDSSLLIQSWVFQLFESYLLGPMMLCVHHSITTNRRN